MLFAVCASVSACASGYQEEEPSLGPLKVDIPVKDTRPKARTSATRGSIVRESPPTSTASKESPFPKVVRTKLGNGLTVATMEAHTLPIVQIRLVVRVGMGYAKVPGSVELTAQMLKDGGTRTMTSAALLQRIEALGASLSVDVGFDSTTFGLAVTKDKLSEAVGLLAELTMAPRFDPKELAKLKARESDEAEEALRGSGTFTATRVLFKELYGEQSPYARYAMLPSEIAKVSLADIKEVHKRFYVPKNATLILAGDIDATATQVAETKLGKWTGEEPPTTVFPPPAASKTRPTRRIVVCDRPKSAQSDVFLVNLAPERRAASWPALRVANQILGGGVASRLFTDVREQRSLAYSARSQIIELANGEQPLLAYAGTETKKTALALQGLLENFDKMKQGVTATESETARRYLSDIFAIRMETLGAIADMVVIEETLRLPPGYWDKYRQELRAVDAGGASSAASTIVRPELAVVVVAGDAEVITPALSHFGEVVVVNPEAEFKVVKTVPMNPGASIEIGAASR